MAIEKAWEVRKGYDGKVRSVVFTTLEAARSTAKATRGRIYGVAVDTETGKIVPPELVGRELAAKLEIADYVAALDRAAKPRRMSRETAKAHGLPLPRELKWADEKKRRAPGAGRKPTDGAARREQVNVRLGQGMTARLARVAAASHRKPSDWARLMIERAIEDTERGLGLGDTPEMIAEKMATVRAVVEAARALAFESRGAMEPAKTVGGVRFPADELASRPETAAPAPGGGVAGGIELDGAWLNEVARRGAEVERDVKSVLAGKPPTSKSVARRLAAQGGPSPACTCQGIGEYATADIHGADCPRGAYLRAADAIRRWPGK